MRTLDVIEFVVAHGQGIVAKDIASGLGIPLSSLSYLLSTLTERGYLRREGRYYLAGPSLDRLRASPSTLSLEERLTPVVRAITLELNETTSFMVREGTDARTVVTVASAQALRYAINPGDRKPLYTLAAGKALLATLSDNELERYFAEAKLTQVTEHSITTEAGLREEIANIRETGFALAVEESTVGICSIGRAVRIDGTLVGAFGTAVPSIRFTTAMQDKARQLLVRASKALSDQWASLPIPPSETGR